MKRSLLALGLLAMLPLSAQAADTLSYSFVEVDYNRASIDGLDADPDGFTLKGSAALGASFYAFGSYFTGSDTIEGLDLDYDQTQLGLGYHHAMSERSDFLAEISYVNAKAEVEDFSVDGDGYRVSAGFRGLLADNFEGYVKGNWDDGSDVDGEFSGTLGAQYKFNATWGITAEAEFGSDSSLYGFGVRASF